MRFLRHGDPAVVSRTGRAMQGEFKGSEQPTCSAVGCDRERLARGMCSPHYYQMKRGREIEVDGGVATWEQWAA
jgi:hypothetical protein